MKERERGTRRINEPSFFLFVFSSLLPVSFFFLPRRFRNQSTATVLSFVVFAVPPSKLDTRLQTSKRTQRRRQREEN